MGTDRPPGDLQWRNECHPGGAAGSKTLTPNRRQYEGIHEGKLSETDKINPMQSTYSQSGRTHYSKPVSLQTTKRT